jgi:hypothetical protein
MIGLFVVYKKSKLLPFPAQVLLIQFLACNFECFERLCKVKIINQLLPLFQISKTTFSN